MAEKQVLGFGTGDAPRNRKTKDSERFTLLAVQATFDGSGAASAFVPTVVVLSDSGDVVGRFPTAAALSVGDDAEVTFAPFLRNDTGLTGIFYGIPNTGGWLSVETTTNGAGGGAGQLFTVDSGTFAVTANNVVNGAVEINTQLVEVFVPNVSFRLLASGETFFGGSGFASWAFGGLELDSTDDVVIVLQTVGRRLDVQDHNGNPIFRVDENGDLHGKTGKALVFDL